MTSMKDGQGPMSGAHLSGASSPSGLIAGVGLTHLTVYDQRPAPDGLHSGCAHVHAVTDEAYFVLSGTGAIELHDLEHGFRSVPLSKGSYVQFTPGTVHRSVCHDRLVVLVIIGNAGLAEHGDARIWFGREVDEDPGLYERLWRLPADKGLEGALERRDRSVSAYLEVLRAWEQDRDAYRAELRRFIDSHARAMAPRGKHFQSVVSNGPAKWLELTRTRIERLPAATGAVLAVSVEPAPGEPKLGMCGLLRPLGLQRSI